MIPLTRQFTRLKSVAGPTGRKRNQSMPCGRIVAFKWTPRERPENALYLCKICAEQAAGNFTDELSKLSSTPHCVP